MISVAATGKNVRIIGTDERRKMGEVFENNYPEIKDFEGLICYCEQLKCRLFFIMKMEPLPSDGILPGEICYCFTSGMYFIYNGNDWVPQREIK